MRSDGGDALERGWSELREGRWTSAREAFEQAVALQAHPAALEGLSWAAWWLDDAAAVFDARERAYKCYRERGDAASAARMATWLAADHLDFHGAVAVANGWIGRAKRLLAGLPPGPDHGWLAFHEGYVAHAGGDLVRAEQLAMEAAALGRRCRVVDLEMLGLALCGATLVARARVAEGMRYLDEATALALDGSATVPISSAWTCCFLVTACVKVHDYERAFQWCDRIAEFADRYGSRYMLAFCRCEYAAVHLYRGRVLEAERALTASAQDFSRSRPALAPMAWTLLAEVRRRQGRSDEANHLLEQAGGSPGAQLCRARMALDGGDTRAAVELLERLLRKLPEQCSVDRSPGLELLVRARAARGDLEGGAQALNALRRIAECVGTERLEAGVELARGLLAMAARDFAAARPCLEDAVDRLERCGAPFETACARIDLAACLSALGRAEEAAREAQAASAALHALGAVTEAERAERIAPPRDAAARTAGHPAVTRREREVLVLVARGRTNREIARELGVSEHTIHRHVANILRKLDLPSRAAAAAHAAQVGLVERP